MIRGLRPVGWIALGALVGLVVFAARPPAQALPEYATRTGQPCATCHVNPAGGGPRTLRGSLWVAQGKPDEVPPLPGGEEQPATGLDGRALFDKFACAGCHGANGEGGVGPAINRGELPADEIAQVVRKGRGAMMAYSSDVMSDEELEAIIGYMQALGQGEGEAGLVLERRQLPPAGLGCRAAWLTPVQRGDCGGN